MKKAVQVLADAMNTLRTGRANPAILDRIMVSGGKHAGVVLGRIHSIWCPLQQKSGL